jgi:hypothetical protein
MAPSLNQTSRAHKGSRDYWERPEEVNDARLELPDSHAKASQRPTGRKRGGRKGRDELMESINGGVGTGR